ncbi:MAG TPA: hypothetical protein VGP82_09615 [Ktedonobacterales bacterium]|nr:hypothetical protein [Ktedonobacterales bacterium]
MLLGVPALNSHRQADMGAHATQTASSVTTVLTVASNLTFGTLTLDGNRLPGRVPQLVTLHEGRYTIALIAPPLHVDACQVRVSSVLGGPNLRIETTAGATRPCSQAYASTLIIPVTGPTFPQTYNKAPVPSSGRRSSSSPRT